MKKNLLVLGMLAAMYLGFQGQVKAAVSSPKPEKDKALPADTLESRILETQKEQSWDEKYFQGPSISVYRPEDLFRYLYKPDFIADFMAANADDSKGKAQNLKSIYDGFMNGKKMVWQDGIQTDYERFMTEQNKYPNRLFLTGIKDPFKDTIDQATALVFLTSAYKNAGIDVKYLTNPAGIFSDDNVPVLLTETDGPVEGTLGYFRLDNGKTYVPLLPEPLTNYDCDPCTFQEGYSEDVHPAPDFAYSLRMGYSRVIERMYTFGPDREIKPLPLTLNIVGEKGEKHDWKFFRSYESE